MDDTSEELIISWSIKTCIFTIETVAHLAVRSPPNNVNNKKMQLVMYIDLTNFLRAGLSRSKLWLFRHRPGFSTQSLNWTYMKINSFPSSSR